MLEQEKLAKAGLQIRFLEQGDEQYIKILADWYLQEWNVPREKTFDRLRRAAKDKFQFQVILLRGEQLISAAGISEEVNLLTVCPEYGKYKHWLALVYTLPEERGKGYGAGLCRYVQNHAKKTGLETLYLYTDTAERLYRRLGWELIEYASMGERTVAIMRLKL